MNGFGRIFWLELTSLVRSRTLAMLAVASVVWVFVLPHLATGDGTPEGARELYLHYSLGGVFMLLVVALLASATGSLARERASKRLALTMVRPVRYGVIVFAKCCALTFGGALVLALACAVVPFASPVGNRPCRHVLAPVLPPVRVVAQKVYDDYMKDPETPATIKRADKDVVLRQLEHTVVDLYDAVQTNSVSRWRFDVPKGVDGVSVRLRFAGQMDSRQELVGVFRLGEWQCVVSNITQAVLEVPLRRERDVGTAQAASFLTFENRGPTVVMVRPRRDIELLIPADAFGWNLVRTYVELVSILALVIAFGLFLSAAFGRPVALFVAIVMLIVGEMTPSVLSQFGDELGAGTADRIGLALSRVSAEVTRPVSSLDPIARLAKDTCVEPHEVWRVVLFDLVLVPLLFALLAGFVLPRKSDAD